MSQTVLKVSWNVTDTTNTFSYSLYYKPSSAPNYSITNIVGVFNTNAVIAAVPYTLYEVYVTAKDSGGMESDPSNKIRAENIYVNGIGKSTPMTLLDVGTANFPGFVLVISPTNGTLQWAVPNITYTTTGTANKDLIAYKSPEIFFGNNITNYYAFYKTFINSPPVLSLTP